MVEARYFRDYRHSYMILQCRQEEVDRSYQFKILTSDRIKEILKCSLRHVNGRTYFYYDISSRTTLESMFRGRKMNFDQVKDLLSQLYGIYSKLGTYFMEESNLVLLPEYIYYDLSERKYIGLYYPDYESEVANPYEPLMDYLLEHIDGQDEHLADCMYRIYEMSEESYFSVEDALQILCGKEEKEAVIIRPETFAAKEVTPVMAGQEEDASSLYEYGIECDCGKKHEEAAGKKSSFYPILAVISLLGIAGAMGIYYFYELSQEEILVLLGCVGLMGFCLLISLGSSLRAGDKKLKNRELKEPPSEDLAESYMPAVQDISLEHVLNKDMDLSMDFPVRQIDKKPLEKQEMCNNTVFFDSTKLAEHKLYALDRKNKQHIDLIKFPYTVGKMAGCVDCVLSDDSISRIHARFEKEGDSIQLTDMNSTNGTFKNGLRMQPQETVEIEPGDEIRFGNLNYCYR